MKYSIKEIQLNRRSVTQTVSATGTERAKAPSVQARTKAPSVQDKAKAAPCAVQAEVSPKKKGKYEIPTQDKVNDKIRKNRRLRENLKGWGVIGPIILYFGIFGLYPVWVMFYNSFFSKAGFFKYEYTGFANYVEFFTDPEYYVLLLNTLLIAVFTIGVSLVLGMLVALLITGPIRGKGAYRTIYYVPVIISMAVVSQIVNVWLDYNNGAFNNVVEALTGNRIEWKDSTFWMYFWIIVICIWKGLGATVILFVAGLSGISQEIHEAAEVDGASGAKKFFKITLPQLRHMFVFVMITSIIGAFNVFEPIQLISGGGPDETTEVILFKIYNEAFENGDIGMANAISVIVLIILMLLTMLNMKFGEEKEDKA